MAPAQRIHQRWALLERYSPEICVEGNSVRVYLHGVCGILVSERRDIFTDVSAALHEVVLGRRPAPPVANQWTKLGPCVDFI